MNLRRIALVSTPVGPIGSGIGGGVELTIVALANALAALDVEVTLIAPQGSETITMSSEVTLVSIEGDYQQLAQDTQRDSSIVMPSKPVLAGMWDYVRKEQDRWDVVVNLAYDWLSFYLTSFLSVSVKHYVTMARLNDAVDYGIQYAIAHAPGSVAMFTRAQANTFAAANSIHILGGGIPLECYEFVLTPQEYFSWAGRIAPEKGLEDAFAAVAKVGGKLHIYGKLQDEAYFTTVCQQYPDVDYYYGGFLFTKELGAANWEERCYASNASLG